MPLMQPVQMSMLVPAAVLLAESQLTALSPRQRGAAAPTGPTGTSHMKTEQLTSVAGDCFCHDSQGRSEAELFQLCG